MAYPPFYPVEDNYFAGFLALYSESSVNPLGRQLPDALDLFLHCLHGNSDIFILLHMGIFFSPACRSHCNREFTPSLWVLARGLNPLYQENSPNSLPFPILFFFFPLLNPSEYNHPCAPSYPASTCWLGLPPPLE